MTSLRAYLGQLNLLCGTLKEIGEVNHSYIELVSVYKNQGFRVQLSYSDERIPMWRLVDSLLGPKEGTDLKELARLVCRLQGVNVADNILKK